MILLKLEDVIILNDQQRTGLYFKNMYIIYIFSCILNKYLKYIYIYYRTAEDYVRHFEQMLMINDCRLKRYAFIVEGLDGPKEYPPESIRVTKRGRPQLFYSENPRISLFINHQQILQTVTIDHREKMRNICEADFIRYIKIFCLINFLLPTQILTILERMREKLNYLNVYVTGIQKQAYANLMKRLNGMYLLMYNYLNRNGIVKTKINYLMIRKKNKKMRRNQAILFQNVVNILYILFIK